MAQGTRQNAVAAAIEAAEPPRGRDDGALDRELARYELSDYGNARRLLARHGRDLFYAHGLGWFCWEGNRWVNDHSGNQIMRFAHLTTEKIRDEVRAMQTEGPEAFPSPKAYEKAVAALRKWATSSGNHQRVRGMLANAAPYLERDVATLDSHPFLFNVRNGTLDLGGELPVLIRPRREHYITRMADVDYDPAAGRPVFDRFLDTVMPRVETQTFLQRYYGMCLTGDVSEQSLVMNCGRGGNGKSTLNNALRAVFGEYADSLKFESLQQDDNRRGREADPDFADLPGVRLVFAAEPESSVKLSSAIVKRFTGGEPLKVRKNFGDFFEFTYQFKLSLSFNDKPAVPSQDEGTWRRLLLVVFERRIPDEQKDPQLDAKLAAEAPGVLNWLVDGFLEWREKRLCPPESVRQATERYRAENDPLGQFLKDCTLREKDCQVSGGELYEAYRKWCDKAGHKPLSLTKFGTVLPDRGYEKVTKGTVRYLDLRLASAFDEPPPGGGDYADL